MDLFLIHWPLPTRYDGDFVSTWQTLEEFYRDGRARSIGVSNFQPHHLRRIASGERDHAGRRPDRGQPVPDARRRAGFCAEHQIAIEAWSPLARGKALAIRPSRTSPGGTARRRLRSSCAGTSSVATSSSPSRSRRPDQGEHRHLRLRAQPARTSRRSARSTATSGPGPTRTSSTASLRADRAGIRPSAGTVEPDRRGRMSAIRNGPTAAWPCRHRLPCVGRASAGNGGGHVRPAHLRIGAPRARSAAAAAASPPAAAPGLSLARPHGRGDDGESRVLGGDRQPGRAVPEPARSARVPCSRTRMRSRTRASRTTWRCSPAARTV